MEFLGYRSGKIKTTIETIPNKSNNNIYQQQRELVVN